MESILNQMLEAQVSKMISAEPYERSDDRPVTGMELEQDK